MESLSGVMPEVKALVLAYRLLERAMHAEPEPQSPRCGNPLTYECCLDLNRSVICDGCTGEATGRCGPRELAECAKEYGDPCEQCEEVKT